MLVDVLLAKIAQAERRTKRKTQFFVFYPEAPPILPKDAKCPQGKLINYSRISSLLVHI